jgi:hypothetical protein
LSILEQKTCHLVQYMVLSFCAKIWQWINAIKCSPRW